MSTNAISNAKQFLTFCLGAEQYGLDVLKVREVLEVPTVTRVPRMPGYIRGVINIRGSVVTVVDLREKLDLESVSQNSQSRVIIIDISYGGEIVSIGILVDSVQEVLEINMEDVTASPHIGTSIDAAYIEGISRQERGFIMLLNIDLVFNDVEFGRMPGSLASDTDTQPPLDPEDFSGLLDTLGTNATS